VIALFNMLLKKIATFSYFLSMLLASFNHRYIDSLLAAVSTVHHIGTVYEHLRAN